LFKKESGEKKKERRKREGIKTMPKKEIISFKDFMNESYKKDRKPRKPLKAYSFIYVNPWAMIDPTVCTVAGVILAFVLVEKFLERKEYFHAMQIIQSILDVVLPVSGLAALTFFAWEVIG
jgi:hypothetical protein